MKKNTKSESSTVERGHCLPLGGKYGIAMAFVIVSIAFSTFLIVDGTIGYVPKVLVLPQAIFAVWVFVYKFGTK